MNIQIKSTFIASTNDPSFTNFPKIIELPKNNCDKITTIREIVGRGTSFNVTISTYCENDSTLTKPGIRKNKPINVLPII